VPPESAIAAGKLVSAVRQPVNGRAATPKRERAAPAGTALSV